MQKENHLFLVDGSGFIYRAFYAIPPLHRKRDGLPVNAISGFCSMLWKLLQNSREQNTASHFAIIFDHSAKTFRNDIYPDYKANRPTIPEMLIPQLPFMRLATQAFEIPSIETKGFEADDIIATYTRIAEEKGFSVTIISKDKDLMQLISPTTCLYDPIKEEIIDTKTVIKKWGVPPERMVCLQALVGDPVDNIPGIPSIGYKTAASLIQEYGNLDQILRHADQIKQKNKREKILEHANIALLSRTLVQLRTDVPITIPIEDLILENHNGPKIISFLKALELTQLTKRVAKACDCDAENIEPASIDIEPVWHNVDAKNHLKSSENQETPEDTVMQCTPHALSLKRFQIIAESEINNKPYIQITNLKELKKWIEILEETGSASFKIITDTTDPFHSQPISISFSILNKDTFPVKVETSTIYIPIDVSKNRQQDGIFIQQGIPIDDVFSCVKNFFENENFLKIGHNIKYDQLILHRYGITMRGFDDVMLISYVLDSGRSSHDITSLSQKWLSHNLITRKELSKSGRTSLSLDKIPTLNLQEYTVENSNIIIRLWLLLKPRLISEKLLSVYERLEKPIVNILAQMEMNGIQIDKKLLSQMSHELNKNLMNLEEKIFLESGEKFNISSPKQLGDILFTKLQLPGGTKTKTGQWKTAAQDLEEIDSGNSPLISLILEWRQLSKLKSTYTDSLPNHINEKTQRVHTFYSLASTITGRLSSLEPNLQNIPIRTDLGRKIRKAFVSPPTKKLIIADYSQIELRILAHVAQIHPLCKAFKNEWDIHAMTASEMFDVKIEEVSPEMRRRAKTINFSVIYGISPFRLASQLKIKHSEASDYIQRYFDRFLGIRDYIEQTKNFARKYGYVETIFGRRIYYADINSSRASVRKFNERAAINAPIQGSAADITRRAMIRVQQSFAAHNLSTKMLLQIHDELIFETAEEEVLQASEIIVNAMENAASPMIDLKAPLKVKIHSADSWGEGH
ncbi:MAG: DNA polymerase I [Candidatus Liberibacter ctenarytainae]|uniref:DNA polymerase I n=1 Tax=Candidatus Liberibacter ctenarytainae TaxID=2020335 RepID=A0A937DJ92_9HYPH|nr:DNA polymerase I [Candidatus Liberibacter ctenarytainae]